MLKLTKRQWRMFDRIRRKHKVSVGFLRYNMPNILKFIAYYERRFHLVLKRCTVRSDRGRKVFIKYNQLHRSLFDEIERKRAKRRKRNTKLWSTRMILYLRRNGGIKEFIIVENSQQQQQQQEQEKQQQQNQLLQADEVTKQLKAQLELLKNGKRNVQLLEEKSLEDVREKVQTEKLSSNIVEVSPAIVDTDSESIKNVELKIASIDEKVEEVGKVGDVGGVEVEKVQPKNMENNQNTQNLILNEKTGFLEPFACKQANDNCHNVDTPKSSANILDLLMSKVCTTTKNPKDTCDVKTKTIAHSEKSKEVEKNEELDSDEEFLGFADTERLPGMLRTPLVRSGKEENANTAFVSESLNEYFRANDLDKNVDITQLTRLSINRRARQTNIDGLMTPNCRPPPFAMPALPETLLKLRTVAERRQYLQKCGRNFKLAIINNEATIYRELQRKLRQPRNKSATQQALQADNSQMSFTYHGWQAASFINTDLNKYYFQKLIIKQRNSKKTDCCVNLYGVRGNNTDQFKPPYTSYPTKQQLQIAKKCTAGCVDAYIAANLFPIQTFAKKKKLCKETRKALVKPCPLSQKPQQAFLDLENAQILLSGGGMAVVRLPQIEMEVFPQIGKPFDDLAKRYLQLIMPYQDITREWAEFSVSTLCVKGMQSPKSRKSFIFAIPYANDRSKILVRRVVPRNEPVDDTLHSAADLEFRANIDMTDTVLVECADALTDMINSVAISCCENSFVTEDPDACSTKLQASLEEDVNTFGLKAMKLKAETKKTPSLKNSRLLSELRRLNATIIDAKTQPKQSEVKCTNDFCALGCICRSLNNGPITRQHCGKPSCMFHCKCNGLNNSRIVRVDSDGSSITTENAFMLRHQATARLARMEKEFTSTIVLTEHETLLINESQYEKKRRSAKPPKRFEDFKQTVDDACSTTKSQTSNNHNEATEHRNYEPRTLNFDSGLKLQKPLMVKDVVLKTLKHCTIPLVRFDEVQNMTVWCMVHQLYKCFCGGRATEGKPVVIEKEALNLPIPAVGEEKLRGAATYFFERDASPERVVLKKMKKESIKSVDLKPISTPSNITKTATVTATATTSTPTTTATSTSTVSKTKIMLTKMSDNQSASVKSRYAVAKLPPLPTSSSFSSATELQTQTQPQPPPATSLAKTTLTTTTTTTTTLAPKLILKTSNNSTSQGIKEQARKSLPSVNLAKDPPILGRDQFNSPPITQLMDDISNLEDEEEILRSYFKEKIPYYGCSRFVAAPLQLCKSRNRKRRQQILSYKEKAEDIRSQLLLNEHIMRSVYFHKESVNGAIAEQNKSVKPPAATKRRRTMSSELKSSNQKEKKIKFNYDDNNDDDDDDDVMEIIDDDEDVQNAIQVELQKARAVDVKNMTLSSFNEPSEKLSTNADNDAITLNDNEDDDDSAKTVAIETKVSDAEDMRDNYNEVIKILNSLVSRKMHDIDNALKRDSKIVPQPTEDILCVLQWRNFLEAFNDNHIYVWEVKIKKRTFLAATVSNMMPMVLGALGVVNICAVHSERLPLLGRMLVEQFTHDETKSLAVIMQGRAQYWYIKGFLQPNVANTCLRPTPDTHPELTAKINTLCSSLIKQRTRDAENRANLLKLQLEQSQKEQQQQQLLKQQPQQENANKKIKSAKRQPGVRVPKTESFLSQASKEISHLSAFSAAAENSCSGITGLKESNIEIRDVNEIDKADLHQPEILESDHRWFVLDLKNDFSHIFIPEHLEIISLDRIKRLKAFAEEKQKSVQFQFAQKSNFDAFIVPHSKSKIYFGPFSLLTSPPELVLLQSVDGKMMTRETYQRVHKIPTKPERTTAFWFSQRNGKIFFDNEERKTELKFSFSNICEKKNINGENVEDNNDDDDDDDDDCIIVEIEPATESPPANSSKQNFTILPAQNSNSKTVEIKMTDLPPNPTQQTVSVFKLQTATTNQSTTPDVDDIELIIPSETIESVKTMKNKASRASYPQQKISKFKNINVEEETSEFSGSSHSILKDALTTMNGCKPVIPKTTITASRKISKPGISAFFSERDDEEESVARKTFSSPLLKTQLKYQIPSKNIKQIAMKRSSSGELKIAPNVSKTSSTAQPVNTVSRKLEQLTSGTSMSPPLTLLKESINKVSKQKTSTATTTTTTQTIKLAPKIPSINHQPKKPTEKTSTPPYNSISVSTVAIKTQGFNAYQISKNTPPKTNSKTSPLMLSNASSLLSKNLTIQLVPNSNSNTADSMEVTDNTATAVAATAVSVNVAPKPNKISNNLGVSAPSVYGFLCPNKPGLPKYLVKRNHLGFVIKVPNIGTVKTKNVESANLFLKRHTAKVYPNMHQIVTWKFVPHTKVNIRSIQKHLAENAVSSSEHYQTHHNSSSTLSPERLDRTGKKNLPSKNVVNEIILIDD